MVPILVVFGLIFQLPNTTWLCYRMSSMSPMTRIGSEPVCLATRRRNTTLYEYMDIAQGRHEQVNQLFKIYKLQGTI
jgi:hypothetical protein